MACDIRQLLKLVNYGGFLFSFQVDIFVSFFLKRKSPNLELTLTKVMFLARVVLSPVLEGPPDLSVDSGKV